MWGGLKEFLDTRKICHALSQGKWGFGESQLRDERAVASKVKYFKVDNETTEWLGRYALGLLREDFNLSSILMELNLEGISVGFLRPAYPFAYSIFFLDRESRCELSRRWW